MSRTPMVELDLPQQQAVLRTLMVQIGDLVANHDLHAAAPRSPVGVLARAHLLTAFALLDGAHKGLALQFVHEALLIGGSPGEDGRAVAPVLSLHGADLRHAALPFGNLGWSTITYADLSHADLRGVSFTSATLSGCRMVEADLRGTKLTDANLMLADLTGANLDGTYLIGTRLLPAQLERAHVTERTVLPAHFPPAFALST
jgi:hypothetical protein